MDSNMHVYMYIYICKVIPKKEINGSRFVMVRCGQVPAGFAHIVQNYPTGSETILFTPLSVELPRRIGVNYKNSLRIRDITSTKQSTRKRCT